METQPRYRRRSSVVTRAAARPEPPSPRPKPPIPRRTRLAALRSRNFRLLLLGQTVATTGMWAQRIAQDWLVLSLTGDATAVGITTALQLAPMLVFGLAGGWIADHYPKRRVLQATQAATGALAAILAVLTLTGHVTAWHIQLLAAVLGIIAAIDQPARLAFVTDLVERDHLHSAISLNSSTYQLGALTGPAVSGALISAVGPGWAFALNAVSYAVPLIAFACIDPDRLPHPRPAVRAAALVPGGMRGLVRRPEIWRPIALAGAFSMFTSSLPVTLSSYARTLDIGPSGYATLTFVVALGSMLGALIAAGRTRTTMNGLTWTGCAVAATYLLAAAMPTPWSLACALAGIGMATTLLFTAVNATVQVAAGTELRGRAIGVYLLVFFGCGALGGPLIGAINQHLGPRIGLALAGAVPAAALLLLSLSYFVCRPAAVLPSGVSRRPSGAGRESTPHTRSQLP
ncbi:MFS transporter [Nonomuraea sp. NPDC003709]|uniref:MFS transporter n=1 Tax=Nonomuraea sp. NPDC003709 TaxID=3154450 RepID=UPI0033AEF6D9